MIKIEKLLAGKPFPVTLLVSFLIVLMSLGVIYLVMSFVIPFIYHLGYLFGQFLGGLF